MHPILKLYEKTRWLVYPIGALLSVAVMYILTCPPLILLAGIVTLVLHAFLPGVAKELAKSSKHLPNQKFQVITCFHFLPIGLWMVYMGVVYFFHSRELAFGGDIGPQLIIKIAAYSIGLFATITIGWTVAHLESHYRKARKNLR